MAKVAKEAQQIVDNLEKMTEDIFTEAKKLTEVVGRDMVEELNSTIAGMGYQIQVLKGMMSKDIDRIKQGLTPRK